jgi:hypothetical protein
MPVKQISTFYRGTPVGRRNMFFGNIERVMLQPGFAFSFAGPENEKTG